MDHESQHQHQEKHGILTSSAFGYTDFSLDSHTGMQSFEPSQELIGLQAGMEMLGIPSKHHQNPDAWRGFFPKAEGSSGDHGYTSSENFMIATETTAGTITNPWQQSNRMLVDDSTLRCLFPAGGDEQPTQGLSLSLFNPEPSDVNAVGLQQPFHRNLSPSSRDGLYSKATNLQQDARFFPLPDSPPTATHYQQPQQLIKSSKYLIPAQELLNEFCSLGSSSYSSKHYKSNKPNKWEEGGTSSSSSWNQSLYSLDLLELQKRKARLLSMLEEADRRYRKYCDQMRAVVSSFEAVTGEGAASVYSTLASKAMSRHFRCLRDGIVGQIQATKKAMGEKDPVAPGTTRGETPRLKLLDQCLRQQKAFQQSGMIENHPWRPQRGLPERSVSVLRAWLFEHFLHPYPSDVDKHILARQTGLSRSQVSNWFINARVRLWKPMVEEMYLQESMEQDNQSSHTTVGHEENNNSSHSRPSLLQDNQNLNPNPSASQLQAEDQKPAPGQLLNDSDSLSSIINRRHRYEGRDSIHGKNPQHQTRQHQQHQQQQVPRAENFGMVDLDFSSFDDCGNQNFGKGVSLTLGLQQHNGGGMSLSFSPASQNSVFFSRENMDDCQPVQFSIIDGEAQNLPYRNLMGAQLLRDLTG